MVVMSTRWNATDAPRGDDYDARWDAMAARGESVHGEADLVDGILRDRGGRRVLDAGCGTGRVGIELAARGYDVVGTDLDDSMLEVARRKAPAIPWHTADLADLDAVPDLVGAQFDLVVLAGNVMIFVAPGTEAAVLAGVAERLVPGGTCVTGFQIRSGRLPLAAFDEAARAAGLEPVDRLATWAGEPYAGGDYVVTVDRRPRA
jgi:SAM-dependent methyltransferase